MKTFQKISLLILTLFFLIFNNSTYLLAETEDIDWDNASPSAIHQKMSEGKAKGLLDKNINRQLAALEGLEDTQQNYDVLFYDIYIRVNDTTEILYGVIKFVALAAQDAVTDIQVYLYNTMTVDSIVSPAETLAFSHNGSVVTVTLDKTYNTGEQFEFAFYYHGHPTEGGLQAFSFGSYMAKPVISTLSEPYFAHTWWPCKDVMWDKADSFNIAIEVDTTFYVGSNGTLDSVIAASNNSHIYYYRVRYPMATYLFSVAISDYTVWSQDYVYNGGLDTMPVVYATYPDQYNYSLSRWSITPTAIGVYEENFGPYPFLNEKYGHSNFTWSGCMEHQTMSSMDGTGFGFTETVIVHELSHQWWGDMITCESWQDIWLNEGWASYAEAVYYLDKYGWSYYRTYMNGMKYTGGGTVYCDDTTDVWRIFDGDLSYDKGAWVVHMLRGVLGESLFFTGINGYYNSPYQHKALTTEKFKNVWEQTTGVELDWFFDEWIFGTYYPNYNYYTYCEESDSGGYDFYLMIEQTQVTNPDVFTMPVDVLIDFDAITDDTVTVFNDQNPQVFKFNFSDTVNYISFDPGQWILCAKAQGTWQMFITTLEEELSEVNRNVAYNDTIEVRGGSGSYSVSVIAGTLPSGLNIDDNGIITGNTSADTGIYTFMVSFIDNTLGYDDYRVFNLHVISVFNCCVGVTGNVDCSEIDEPDISDITRLIDFLYLTHEPLCCLEEADVDVSGGDPDISDITRLIDFLYLTHIPLANCP